uniref:Antitoxin n=1 Tax=viral metagenome TaxID=1070528 RepID=A0A6H1ZKI7_9ZZZZ
MLQLSIREFNKNITKWLNSGKRFIITKNGKDLVKVIPVSEESVVTPLKEVVTKKVVATPKQEMTMDEAKRILKAPQVCPKHQGRKIGDKYSCGCKVC